MRLMILSAVLMLGCAPAFAESITEDTVGCVSRDDQDRALRFARQGDREAYVAFLTDKVANGECALLATGDEVFLDESGFMDGLWCVRPRGQTECVFVEREYVGD